MKKILIGILFFITFIVFNTGCTKNSNIESMMKKKIENSKNYHITGILEIMNNENNYKYDVDVSYKKTDNFRVSLKNKTNEHEQIILKNEEGVFV